MFDNLRQQIQDEQAEEVRTRSSFSLARFGDRRILGLTPSQLFIVSLVLFVNVTMLGCFALIAFEKVDISKLF